MKRIRINLDRHETYSDDISFVDLADGQDGSLNSLIARLIQLRDSVPEEFRSQAACKIDIDYGYEAGDTRLYADIFYERPQSLAESQKEERDKREAEATRNAEEYRRARHIYETLKAQFEPNS